MGRQVSVRRQIHDRPPPLLLLLLRTEAEGLLDVGTL
jgi:hypothetical protein